MSSPSSCPKCERVVDVLSSRGLCPICAATDNTADPTPPVVPVPFSYFGDVATAASRVSSLAPTVSARLSAETADAPADARPLPHAPAGYELVESLGHGGMGDVYLARELASDRLVAMKFLRNVASPDAFDRFAVELKSLAKLDHPNIVRVLSHDFLRAQPYFTMEYLPGGSLSRSRDGAKPLTSGEAISLFRTIAAAVAFLHAHGVIHRDLKPSNVLLDANGVPKVADLGLAKRLDEYDDLTDTTSTLGTPGYMPPEQISRKNGAIGTWSDVYGLGATLYALLTDRAPFVGPTPVETTHQVLADPPDRPRALRPAIPLGLEAIVLKCLAKDLGERYPTVADLLTDLDRYEAGLKTLAPPLTRGRRAKQWVKQHRRGLATVTAAVALVAGAFVLGAVYWSRPMPHDPQEEMRRKQEEARKELAAGRPVTLIGEKGLPFSYRWAFGPTVLAEAPAFENACSFETIESSLLELLSDPGCDAYEVRADLRLLKLRLPGGGVAAPGLANVAGLYFAESTPDGVSHAFMAAAYNDRLDPALPPLGHNRTCAQLQKVCLIPNGLRGPIEPTGGLTKKVFFPPVANLPGEWRRTRIEVRPERVRAFWTTSPAEKASEDKTELLGDVPIADIDQIFRDQRATLDAARPGLGQALPNWNPRMPIGIWCRGGAVAVKNVIVTPLPRK